MVILKANLISWKITLACNERVAQCGNYTNLLSHILFKLSWVTFLLKSWFDVIFFGESKFCFIFPCCELVTLNSSKLNQIVVFYSAPNLNCLFKRTVYIWVTVFVCFQTHTDSSDRTWDVFRKGVKEGMEIPSRYSD